MVHRQLAYKENTANSFFDDLDCIGPKNSMARDLGDFFCLCFNNLVFSSNLEPSSNPKDSEES